MRLRLTQLAAALLAAAALAGQATVLPYKTFDQLVKEADGIVLGTVQRVESTGARPDQLQTFVTIAPQDVISGTLRAPTLTLRLKGGFDGQQGLHVDGAPHFEANERVLLFVKDNGRDLVPFVGWSQGVFRLVVDPASGLEELRDADGNPILGLRDGHLLREAGAHTGVGLVGAPDMQLMRSPAAQMSAGSTEDGSAVVELEVRQLARPPMTAQRFLDAVRARASAGAALRSVNPHEVAPTDLPAADRAPATASTARHPVAQPAEGAVAAPARRPDPTGARD